MDFDGRLFGGEDAARQYRSRREWRTTDRQRKWSGRGIEYTPGQRRYFLRFQAPTSQRMSLQWGSNNIAATNFNGVPVIDLKYILGTLSPAAAGFVGIDWAHVNNATSTVGLSNTSIMNSAMINGVYSVI